MDAQNIPKSPVSALEKRELNSRQTALQRGDHKPFWGADGFTFDDVLDMVNPLQHVPVASKHYQEATGDTASEGATLVGGVVFGVLTGGILGLVASLVNAAVRHDTGKDLTDHALALMEGESPTGPVESVTKSEKPTESPAYPQHEERTNFFVDDVAARSLHPAERLLAISSHYATDNTQDSDGRLQKELEPSLAVSMKHKVSEVYREVADDIAGQFWGEV